MALESKLFDFTVGYGSHGQDCCGHNIVGVRITGSPNTNVNGLATSRALIDIASHNCPHCPINMCITGSPNVFTNNLSDHRLGDYVTEFCGVGITISSCANVHDNG